VREDRSGYADIEEKVRYIKRGSRETGEWSTSLARDRQQEYGFLVAEYLWHNRGSQDAEITRWLSILAALLYTRGVPDTYRSFLSDCTRYLEIKGNNYAFHY